MLKQFFQVPSLGVVHHFMLLDKVTVGAKQTCCALVRACMVLRAPCQPSWLTRGLQAGSSAAPWPSGSTSRDGCARLLGGSS